MLIQIKKLFHRLLSANAAYGFRRKTKVRSDLMLWNTLFYGWVLVNKIEVLFFRCFAIGCKNSSLMGDKCILQQL